MLASQHGLADKAASVLYEMCYERGENISLREVVSRAAVEVGVPDGETYINGDDGFQMLEDELSNSNVDGKRVRSVPTFLVEGRGGRHSFSGAIETASWLSLLKEVSM